MADGGWPRVKGVDSVHYLTVNKKSAIRHPLSTIHYRPSKSAIRYQMLSTVNRQLSTKHPPSTIRHPNRHPLSFQHSDFPISAGKKHRLTVFCFATNVETFA